ncbi:YcfL family protein [Cerasicoccus frondis]|uniref:YcfL family protein n=1 Tax=Cerasicoccus frondis TaxID=490090 RepID=UPI0028527E6D|nr:YcfL family protein [Cerasicoccus frondis]
MKRVCYSLLAVTFLAVLAGCNSVNTVEPANPKAEPNLIAIKKVETDPALARKVEVVDVNEGQRGDLMFVQVQVENQNYGPEDFNYQFTWIEADGFEVQSPPALWKSGFILGREKIFLTSIAPNPRVVDFRLKLLARETYNATVGQSSRPKRGY